MASRRIPGEAPSGIGVSLKLTISRCVDNLRGPAPSGMRAEGDRIEKWSVRAFARCSRPVHYPATMPSGRGEAVGLAGTVLRAARRSRLTLAGGMRAVEVGVAAGSVSENLTDRLSNDVDRPQYVSLSAILSTRLALCTVLGIRSGVAAGDRKLGTTRAAAR